ncbi:MAG: peptidase S8/S53 subtilisin kexin sedolisin, partial [Bacteroidia bacterium]|nr:peptidase S8/S53 subtilisin kexin sedolisin [Bacteroidia bacterium]
MHKIYFLLIGTGLLISKVSNAQNKRYFIEFTDRANSPYNIQNPQQYLSQRAIDRRSTQGIAIIDNDLPVNPSYADSIQKIGVTVVTKIKWLNGVIIETNNPAKVTQINSLGFV